MSNLIEHAKREFQAAGWTDETGNFKDNMQQSICNHLLELLTVFGNFGHSGFTASYTINLFKDLVNFLPISPLLGTDSEWSEVERGIYQNNRCPRLFKRADRFNGQAYDIEGVVWYDCVPQEDGTISREYFTNIESHIPIIFPYIPKTKYLEKIRD